MATPVQTPCVLSNLKSSASHLRLSNNQPSAAAAAAFTSKPQGLRRNRSSSMKRLLRRLSRVAAVDAYTAAGAYQPLRPDEAAKASAVSSFSGARRLGGGARVPEGHVPVCVGEEGGPVERFAVRTELLGQPGFAALLRRAAQEYGYGHPGALRIPCPVADFRLSTACDHADADDALLY